MFLPTKPPPPAICTVVGCSRDVRVKKRGLCNMHYSRWQKSGDPTVVATSPRGLTAEERFLYHTDRTDGCWLWHGTVLFRTEHRSYGLLWTGTSQVLAHRWAYERWVGPVPEGMELDHLCREPRCVRPEHLEAVTHGDNVRRGNRWGKAVRRV